MSSISEEEPTISINWLLFDGSRELTTPLYVDIPRSLFEKKSDHCQNTFVPLLLEHHEIKVAKKNILFWKPKTTLLLKTVGRKGWAKNTEDLEDAFERVLAPESFAKALDTSNESAVHLVITIDNLHSGTTVEESQKSKDIHTLSDLQRFFYNNYVHAFRVPGISPSAGAKSLEYIQVQGKTNEKVHDGRHPLNPPFATVAPPIQMYHPIFDQFLRCVNDPSVQPSDECLKLTLGLMRVLSSIDTSEVDRHSKLRRHLSAVLGVSINEERNANGIHADGTYIMSADENRMPILILEFKREIGDGECDPSTQAGLLMRHYWHEKPTIKIRDGSCCPGFILAGGGPWMAVLGSVHTHQMIVQRLTDLSWFALSSIMEDTRIYRFARVLTALNLCIRELGKYYKGISDAVHVVPTPDHPHPRFYPYPKSFTDDKKNAINFEYLHPLELDTSSCVTFKAKTSEDKEVVVKFVSAYGVEVHKFLAEEGHAPKLLYCGPLPDTTIPPLPTTFNRAGLSLGPLQMVVMEYILSCEKPPPDARQQLETILEKLHGEGYVFGDLRNQNILFDEENQVKLIDFDWAGRFDMKISDDSLASSLQERIKAKWESIKAEKPDKDYVHYPLNISTTVGWAAGVAGLEAIRPSHDWGMLNVLDLSV